MHGKSIEQLNEQEAKEPTIRDPYLNDLMQRIGLSYAADMPEFQELMAAINDITSGWYYADSIGRLVEAKKKLLARVVK